MDVILIAAYTVEKRVIGKDNRIPWHIPEDLKHFKELTIGHPAIMGRITYDSIIDGLGGPLPGRTNIVLTRNPNHYRFPADVHVFDSLEEALGFAERIDNDVYVIGGQRVYEQALPFSNRLEITEVYADYEGDVFFPDFSLRDWEQVYTGDKILSGNGIDVYRFVTYERGDIVH